MEQKSTSCVRCRGKGRIKAEDYDPSGSASSALELLINFGGTILVAAIVIAGCFALPWYFGVWWMLNSCAQSWTCLTYLSIGGYIAVVALYTLYRSIFRRSIRCPECSENTQIG